MPSSGTKKIWRTAYLTGPVDAQTLRVNHEELAIKLFLATDRARGLQPWKAIQNVFRLHFGIYRTESELMLFKHWAAPLVRRAALVSQRTRLTGDPRHIAILRQVIAEIRVTDPEALRVIDLRFFARCRVGEIAAFYAATERESFVGDAATYAIHAIESELEADRQLVQSKLNFCKKLYRIARLDKREASWRFRGQWSRSQ